jgi:tetratricopeptide (TPR) repeat protein
MALLLWELSVGTSLRTALRRQWTSWALLLAGAVYFLLSDRYLQHMQNSAQLNSLAGNVATQATALVYLARQWLLPFWLNIDPDLPVQHDFSQALPAMFFVALWLGAMVFSWRKRPWVGLALAWAFLHWVPLYVFLPRLDVANDRQLYLAVWPLGLVMAMELQLLLTRRLALVCAVALVLGGAALTAMRNQDYHSEIALWESTMRLSPGKSRVHNNLGFAYREAGRLDDARSEYLTALRLDPDNVKARLNLRRLNVERAQGTQAAP